MDYPKAHVAFHLAEPVSDGEMESLQHALERLAGVPRVEASMRLARLLVIDHDPGVVSARSILASVKRRGYTAQLVASQA